MVQVDFATHIKSGLSAFLCFQTNGTISIYDYYYLPIFYSNSDQEQVIFIVYTDQLRFSRHILLI